MVLPSRLLRPALWLGTISYAAYLWNWPFAHWTAGLGSFSPIAGILGTLAAATLSWWIVEKPSQRLKSALDRRRAEIHADPLNAAVGGGVGG
jgi:peptidoglycan/LPS O-acetylase OafA/YrhL